MIEVILMGINYGLLVASFLLTISLSVGAVVLLLINIGEFIEKRIK